MKRYTGAVTLAAGAVVAAGMLTACSDSSNRVTSPTGITSSTVAAMPQSATFMADVPEANGTTMTMAITVEGDKVVAFTTDGVKDEAYFKGTQKDGTMTLTSMYGDTLKASFNGTVVSGTVLMNESNSVPTKFKAASVPAPAGIYTAAHDNMRATWVVRPDHTLTGVMNNSAPGDHKITDAIMAQNQAFMDQVRQMRVNLQLHQAPPMTYGTWTTRMGGTTMNAVRVTGDMSF